MSIYDDLNDILTEEPGEDVAGAIVDAVQLLENEKYPTAGTLGDRILIANDAYGVNVKNAIHDALKKLASVPYYTRSNIVRLSQQEYEALSEYEDVLYGIIDETIIYISELDEVYSPTGVVMKVNRLRDASDFFLYHETGKYHIEIGKEFPVHEMQETLFFGCRALYSIVIPDSFTSISSACFWNSGLTEIWLPSTLQTIEHHAFSGTKLVAIDIPKNVTTIGENVFESCNDLTIITIHAPEDSISGAPWGADASVTIEWVGGE